MSLLLDALKKAEEAKRRKREAELAGEAAPAAETQAAPAGTDAAFPALELEPDAPPAEQSAAPATSPDAPSGTVGGDTRAPLEFAPSAAEPAPPAHVTEMPPPVLTLPPLELPGAPRVDAAPSAPTDDTVLALHLLPPPPPAPPATTDLPSPELTLPPLSAPAAPAEAKETTRLEVTAADRFSGRTGRFGSSGAEAPHEPSAEPSTDVQLPPLASPVTAARAERAPVPAPSPAAPPPLSAEGARTLFAAKQPEAGKRLAPRTRAALLLAPLLLIGMAAGAYLWWQLSQVPSGIGAPGLAVNTPPASPAPPANPAVTNPGANPAANPPSPSPAEATPPAAAAAPPVATATPAPPISQPQTAVATPREAPPAPPPLPVQPKKGDRARVVEVPTQLAAEDVHFTRNSTPPSVAPNVSQGYQAYQQGNYDAAASAYRRQLALDPNNRDALLGLAAVALQQRRPDEARAYYQQVLALDPKDEIAAAALTSLGADTNPEQTEAQLKRSYASQPSPEVATALGGLLARQQRWSEAQDYYFKAYSAAPDEPDNAYNLAVSLDALGQGKLARGYYERALSARKPGTFKRDEVRRRMMELSGS